MTAYHEGFDCDILSQSAQRFHGRAQNVLCFSGGINSPAN